MHRHVRWNISANTWNANIGFAFQQVAYRVAEKQKQPRFSVQPFSEYIISVNLKSNALPKRTSYQLSRSGERRVITRLGTRYTFFLFQAPGLLIPHAALNAWKVYYEDRKYLPFEEYFLKSFPLLLERSPLQERALTADIPHRKNIGDFDSVPKSSCRVFLPLHYAQSLSFLCKRKCQSTPFVLGTSAVPSLFTAPRKACARALKADSAR